jgi:CheY-like chemotaxis protein
VSVVLHGVVASGRGLADIMALDPKSRVRFNLSNTAILLLDPTPMGMAILVQIVTGLGAKQLHRCSTVLEAKEVVTHVDVDLMIVDGIAESGEGYEFVRWLRRDVPEPNRHAPVLLTAGHTMISDVAKARDCGSHFIITKPIAPIVMLERIIWVAKEGRLFLLSDNYVGPDRRFRNDGRSDAPAGRRREDQPRPAETPDAANEKPPAVDDASEAYTGDFAQKAAS